MHSLIHFAVVAGLTIVSIIGAHFVLDQFGIPQADGFGWDDVILGTVTALGVTTGMFLYKKVA